MALDITQDQITEKDDEQVPTDPVTIPVEETTEPAPEVTEPVQPQQEEAPDTRGQLLPTPDAAQYGPEIASLMTGQEEVTTGLDVQQSFPFVLPTRTSGVTPEIEQRKEQEGQAIMRAKTFRAGDGTEMAFPPNADLNTRYTMLAYYDADSIQETDEQGRGIVLGDANGQPILDEKGVPKTSFSPLAIAEEYQQYITPDEDMSGIEKALDFASRHYAGETGHGDMADIDKNLQNAGITSQIQRTLIMRNIATGQTTLDEVMAAPWDLAKFVLTLPKWAVQGVSVAGTHLGDFIAGDVLGLDTEIAMRTMNSVMDPTIEALDPEQLFGLSDYVTMKADGRYRPEVIAEAIAARGVRDVALSMALTDGMFYGPLLLMKWGGGVKAVKGLESHLATKYGGETLTESLEAAINKGMTPREIVSSYVAETVEKKSRNKLAQQIEVGIANRINAGDDALRTSFFREEVDAVNGMIDESMSTLSQTRSLLDAAKAKGDNAAIARYEKEVAHYTKVVESNQERRNRLLYDQFVPESTRNMYAEYGLGVAGATAMHVTYQQMFAGDAEGVQFAQMGGALGATIQIGSYSGPNMVMNVVDSANALFKAIADRPSWNPSDIMREFQTNRFARTLAKSDPVFQDMVWGSVETAAAVRRELIALASETGMPINVNAPFETLTAVAGLVELSSRSSVLDSVMTNPDFNQVAKAIMNSRSMTDERMVLLQNLSEMAEQVLALRASTPIDADSPVARFSNAMNEAVTMMRGDLERSLAEQAAVLKLHQDTLEASMSARMLDASDADGSMAAHEDLKNLLDAETNAEYKQSLEDIYTAIDEKYQLLHRINGKVTAEAASMGAASSGFGHLYLVRQAEVDRIVNQKYTALQENFPDTYANAADFYNTYKNNPNAFVGGDASKASLEIAGYRFPSTYNRNLAMVFNNAAASSFKMIDQQFGTNIREVFESLDIASEAPILQREYLQRALMIGDESVAELDALLQSVAGPGYLDNFDDIFPLHVSPEEYKNITSGLGSLASKKGGTEGYLAGSVYGEWKDMATDPNSRGRFMSGWSTGQLRDVTEDFIEQYKDASEYYRVEKLLRTTSDRDLKSFSGTFTARRRGEVGEEIGPEGTQRFAESYVDVTPGDKPVEWLNTLFDRIRNKGTLTGSSATDELYTNIGEAFGKVAGSYDPKTKRFLLVVDSADPADQSSIKAVRELQTLVTRGLQGELMRTEAGRQLLSAEVLGKVEANFGTEYKWDKNLIDSLMNIEVYRRNEDGTFTATGKLLDEDDVYEVLDPRTWIAMDAKGREAYEKGVGIFEGKIKPQLEGGMKEAKEAAQREIAFVDDLSRALFRRGAASEVAPNEADVGKALYDKIVGGDFLKQGGEFDRLLVTLQRVDPEKYSRKNVEEMVSDLVVDHMRSQFEEISGFTPPSKMGKNEGATSQTRVSVNPTKLLETIGYTDPKVRARLAKLLPEEKLETLDRIGTMITRLYPQKQAADGSISIRTTSMSLESMLARVFAVKRGVISPQWVAIESIIRSARSSKGALLKSMLNDADFADEVMRMIETDSVPSHMLETNSWRALTLQISKYNSREKFQKDAQGFGFSAHYTSYLDKEMTYLTESAVEERDREEAEAAAAAEAEKKRRAEMTPYEQKMEGMGFATQQQE